MVGVPNFPEFTVGSVPYDGDYVPVAGTRATTNFANLALNPETRRNSIETFLASANTDLNGILDGDADSARFSLTLEIVRVSLRLADQPVPTSIALTEVMRAQVIDSRSGERLEGPIGLNYSSYLRDYDFRVVLPDLLAREAPPDELDDFGKLHGLLTQMQFGIDAVVPGPLTIAISISQNRDYQATAFVHPILGREYTAAEDSLTDGYFRHMGLAPRFFRPVNLPAPLAIYATNTLCDHSDAYLAALIAVMGNFQRIYRPEIYLATKSFSETPGEWSRASLSNPHHALPPVRYDRQEREVLADHQARHIETLLLRPHADLVERLRDMARNQ